MARIPQHEIERLKTEISLVRLIESSGLELKKKGADYHGHCPFHDDKTPSLVVSPKNNLWHCLGACQTGGSVIDWVMKKEGVSFRLAAEMLRSDLGFGSADDAKVSVSASQPITKTTQQKLPTLLEPNAEDQAALNCVIDFYHQTLKQSPEALEYLQSRGLTDPALIDNFKLGFANRTLGYQLPAKNRKAGAELREQLQRVGILRDSGHEHFNGSLVVPILNEADNVVEAYGRKLLGKRLRKGTPLHLYLPGPHRGVWNLQALQAASEIILCESLIDAMTFWCAGYRNVTTSYGVEGFTPDMLAAFKSNEIKRILIAYDRDEAGESAATKLSDRLTKEGIDCFRLHFPKGMDANEYALQVQPASKSLGVVIRSAVWMGKGKKPVIETAAGIVESTATKEESPAEPSSLAAESELSEPTTASPLPDPAPEIPADINEREIIINLGDRRYRIRGMDKNHAYDHLKINLLTSRGDAYHVDQLDLYSARHRAAYIKQAAIELGLKDDAIKRDLGKVLLKCEAIQDQQIRAALEPEDKEIHISDADKDAALSLLKSPDLLDHVLSDFSRCGVVGEETNKLTGYLAAVSRKLSRPLAVIIRSTSAAGKSALMDAVLDLVPDEERVHYSAMTGQSLFYMGETQLKNKILAIAEEEGVEEAAYALKILQSQGELTIASTGKDATTGKLITHEYRVEGPVMIFLTTTAIDIDEELLNRCLVLTVNESREQTQAIHKLQRMRRTLDGLKADSEKQAILNLHRNAQRLLRPLAVMNPYAEQLGFIDDRTRARRDHEKYLSLIDSIALLHQYQRKTQTVNHAGQTISYVEVEPQDIETANRLAHEVLGRSLDELPPQTRTLLPLLHDYVADKCQALEMSQADFRFSRREIREVISWSDTALKVHMARLVEMEYLIVHRGGRGHSFVYELLYAGEGQQGENFMTGLLDAETLKHEYDAKWSGQKASRSGSGQHQVRGRSAGGQASKSVAKPDTTSDLHESDKKPSESTYKVNGNGNASYRSDALPLAASARA